MWKLFGRARYIPQDEARKLNLALRQVHLTDGKWASLLGAISREGQPPLVGTEAVRRTAQTVLRRLFPHAGTTSKSPFFAASSVVLTGMAGIGKTSTLKALAHVGEHVAPHCIVLYVSGKDVQQHHMSLGRTIQQYLTNRYILDWQDPAQVPDMESAAALGGFWSRSEEYMTVARTMARNRLRLVLLLDDVEDLFLAGAAGTNNLAAANSRFVQLALSNARPLQISVVACVSSLERAGALGARVPGVKWRFIPGGRPDDFSVVRQVCDTMWIRTHCPVRGTGPSWGPGAMLYEVGGRTADIVRCLRSGRRPDTLPRNKWGPGAAACPPRLVPFLASVMAALRARNPGIPVGFADWEGCMQGLQGLEVLALWTDLVGGPGEGCDQDLWWLCDNGYLCLEFWGDGPPACTQALSVYPGSAALLACM